MTEAAAPASHSVTASLRVGLIGLNRQGWHLMERCLNGGPFQVVKTADLQCRPKRERTLFNALHLPADEVAAASGAIVLADASVSVEEIIVSPDIDVAWIAHPIALRPADLPPDLIEQLLKQKKHVVVETPLSLSATESERLFAVAREQGRRLLVYSPQHTTANICQAIAVANNDEFGAVLAAKWISWGYALPPAGVPCREPHVTRLESQSSPGDCQDQPRDELFVVLIRQMARALDQLVQLIPQAPQRIFAFGRVSQSETSHALAAWIEFKNGANAEIDIRLNSPTPLHTGWVLHSGRGGFVAGRRYSLTPEGEVFDSPAPSSVPQLDDLASLAHSLRSENGDDRESARSLAVVELLEAICQSANTRSVVNRG
ncbi:MAG: Gfo/Idh/MocA family oxidoreductase [Planctomycetia bacterium]|nr:Gfo/Idh/MocA family oxidoreductase [Planctomycetia bacterium]